MIFPTPLHTNQIAFSGIYTTRNVGYIDSSNDNSMYTSVVIVTNSHCLKLND